MTDIISKNIIIYTYSLITIFNLLLNRDIGNLQGFFPQHQLSKFKGISQVEIFEYYKDSLEYRNIFKFDTSGNIIYSGVEDRVGNIRYSKKGYFDNSYVYNIKGDLIAENISPNSTIPICQKYHYKYINNGQIKTIDWDETLYYGTDAQKLKPNIHATDILYLDIDGKIIKHVAKNVSVHVAGNWYKMLIKDYIYDNIGNLVRIDHIDTIENSSGIFPHFYKTYIKYNALQQVKEIRFGHVSCPMDSLEKNGIHDWVEYEYNNKGQIILIRNKQDSLSVSPMNEYIYDSNNHIIKEIKQFGNGVPISFLYSHNDNGFIKLRTELDKNGKECNNSRTVYKYKYN